MKILNFFEKINEKLWDHLGNIWDKLDFCVPRNNFRKKHLTFQICKTENWRV